MSSHKNTTIATTSKESEQRRNSDHFLKLPELAINFKPRRKSLNTFDLEKSSLSPHNSFSSSTSSNTNILNVRYKSSALFYDEKCKKETPFSNSKFEFSEEIKVKEKKDQVEEEEEQKMQKKKRKKSSIFATFLNRFVSFRRTNSKIEENSSKEIKSRRKDNFIKHQYQNQQQLIQQRHHSLAPTTNSIPLYFSKNTPSSDSISNKIKTTAARSISSLFSSSSSSPFATNTNELAILEQQKQDKKRKTSLLLLSPHLNKNNSENG